MKTTWLARIVTGIPVAFLALDGAIKLFDPAPVRDAMAKLGIPDGLAPALGVVLLGCLALYMAKRTAPIGAVLLTGFLGGAVAMHVRVGDPLATHVLTPVYVAVLLWGGLYLRDTRVRALVKGL